MKAVVLAVVLAVVPVQAWAECAWVLWMNNGVISDQPPWVPFGAFVTQRDCVVGAQKAFDKFKSKGMSVVTEDPEGGVFLITTAPRPSGVMVAVAIKWLPDTIDPRGPKGTQR
jgi:hypothetical protein